ncbi:MAG TPA: helix-turn-helix domain-containing protein, partial [Longimicrobium sp.]|nr:helix-turn-helix domain-containing protein [Longimicrobium sp.]
APRLDRAGTAARMTALCAACGGLPLVLVTSDAPESLRHLMQVPVAEVVFLSEKKRLSGALDRATARALFNRLDASVRRCPGLPPQVRAALLFMAAGAPPDHPAAIGEPFASIHTVQELARQRGLSPDYLRRACKAAGVDLRRFIRWCLALRALELRQVEGLSWEHTAWRMGFASTSGLSEHLQRTLGLRPRGLGDTDLHALLARFESVCMGGCRTGAAPEPPGGRAGSRGLLHVKNSLDL